MVDHETLKRLDLKGAKIWHKEVCSPELIEMCEPHGLNMMVLLARYVVLAHRPWFCSGDCIGLCESIFYPQKAVRST